MDWFKGKKTILGSLLVSLLSAMYWLDQLTPESAWLTEQQYLALGGVIAGLTGVALRLAVKNPK